MEKTNETPSISAKEVEKRNSSSFNYAEFGQYLDGIETQLSPWQTLEKLDDTVRQVEEELDSYNTEIMSADKETKRKMAVTTTESYILNLLARDKEEVQTAILENPNCNDALRFRIESARGKATA